jgi:pyrophosphatase PpaX
MAAHPRTRPRSSPAPAAAVFDFDGTLVATRFADEAAVAELLAVDPSAAAGVDLFWSHEGEPILSRIELAWPGRGGEILPLFERQGAPRVYPGVLPMLDGLRRSGRRLAVVSSRRRDALVAGLETARLRDYFPVVVGLDDVSEPKPSPEGLLLAMRRLGVGPERAVYVGDNALDVEAGRRAGTTVWRAVWGIPPLSPNGVVMLQRPAEVTERLRQLDRG